MVSPHFHVFQLNTRQVMAQGWIRGDMLTLLVEASFARHALVAYVAARLLVAFDSRIAAGYEVIRGSSSGCEVASTVGYVQVDVFHLSLTFLASLARSPGFTIYRCWLKGECRNGSSEEVEGKPSLPLPIMLSPQSPLLQEEKQKLR